MKSRVQLAIGTAVLAVILVVAVLIWVDRMRPVSITISSPGQPPIAVSVSGAVGSPGVVEVPAGARLQEVVDAAGGFTEEADTTQLHLAGRVGDGEDVDIPTIGDARAVSSEGALADDLVDVNTATLAELDQLPGIGEILAGRIVAYREANGPFTSLDELSLVEGISPRLVDELRPFVTVSTGG